MESDRWWIGHTLGSCAADRRPGHTYLRPDGTAVALSRADLHDLVACRAGDLAGLGVRAGDRVAVVAADPETFAPTFLALLWLGAIAVPVPPPPVLSRQDAWRESIGEALALARPMLVVGPAAIVAALAGAVPVAAVESLAGTQPHPGPVPFVPEAPAYAQFTSGSTGRPRAVLISRGNLAANSAAIGAGLGLVDGRDVGVCWLPLHHDMGLVGFLCAALAAGAHVVFMPTSMFVRDPSSWMRTVSAYRGTVTFGPPFAYALAARRARPETVAALDLSSVRVLGCGAEPIRAEVLRRFVDTYAPAGLAASAVVPSYGLAESTLAVSFARGLREREGIVDCGRPVPGHEIAVLDEHGERRADGEAGEVWVRGPSVAAGYLDEPPGDPFRSDGWLRTGDLGFLRDGGLHVTGRSKDQLIVRGVNVDPHRVEWLAATVPGVRESGVVAFTRPGADTEEIVVVAECTPGAPAGIEDEVRRAVAAALGLDVAHVVRARPGAIARTTSGKPRRQETRRRYLIGNLTADMAQARGA